MKHRSALSVVMMILLIATLAACSSPGRDTLDEDWPGYGRTGSSDHHSPLAEIDADTIGGLGLAWWIDLDSMGSVFTSPIAVGGTVYFAQGYSVIHAVDAVTGKELWRHDPKVYEVAPKKMRSSWGVRGIAYADGRIFTGTADGRLIALDAKSGKLIWSSQTTQGPDDGRYITGAPWVIGDKVIIGHGGADFDFIRGYVTAYDARTGEQRWRFFTVPGDPRKGFEDRAQEMAAKTWTGEWWKYGGGGTVWNAMAYDAKRNLVFIGTGNGTPWNAKLRSPQGGDNLFLSSIVALDAGSGKYVWHYQANPGESWDYNAAMDIELATIDVDGKKRDVLMHAPKNGFFYVIDRQTGTLISARNFVPANWASGIDKRTGRPIETPRARFAGEGFTMTPGPVGGHNVQPMSFSPKTGLAYIPAVYNWFFYSDAGVDLKAWKGDAKSGHLSGLGVEQPPKALPADAFSVVAWNPVTQTKAWEVRRSRLGGGGILSTGGNLIFFGDGDGEFKAYDASRGRKLWSFDAQAGISGQPISFAVNGEQYVILLAGFRGLISSSPWDYRKQPRRLLAFKLGGTAKLPAAPRPTAPQFVISPARTIDPVKAAAGQAAYLRLRCYICHGANLAAGGSAPDLRQSAVPADAATFRSVVRDGALEPQGMPRFDEANDETLGALAHYILSGARDAERGQKSQEGQLLRQ